MSEAALAVIESKTDVSPAQMWRATTERAALVKQAVLSCTVNIQGKRYLNVAGYQAIANAFGCVAAARDVEYVNGIGWKCVGEVRRISDGVVLSTGVGFVGDDEKMWASRPVFARVAMCQTRACGRALRAAFAFMAPLIDAGLETTPAEEMDLVVTSPSGPSQSVAEKAARVREVLTAARQVVEQPKASPPRSAPVTSGLPTVFPNFGRAKGAPIAGASEKDLEFYASAARRSLEDLSKAKWHDKERAMLAAIEVEQERQRNASGQGEDGPPPHSDEDAPF